MSTFWDLATVDLKRDEGRRDRPYRDTVGKLTIGYGHNLDASGLCEDALSAQLAFDMRLAAHDLDRLLPWWASKPDTVRRVMLNLSFNLGIGRLLAFKRTLELLRLSRYAEAADALLDSLYARQVGDRAKRLAALLRSVV